MKSFPQDYIPVDQEELRDYVKARLKVFYEEELDVPLVLFNEVLDHVLRIDRWAAHGSSTPSVSSSGGVDTARDTFPSSTHSSVLGTGRQWLDQGSPAGG